jgi:hypothetical protein
MKRTPLGPHCAAQQGRKKGPHPALPEDEDGEIAAGASPRTQATFFDLRRYLAGAISRVTYMADQALAVPALAGHGSSTLPSVEVEAHNVELEDDEGFVGDRACKGAFRAFIESWRKPLREIGHDPFGDEPSSVLTKKNLDALLTNGDPEAAGVIHGAIESFAQELALVTRRFLKLKGWKASSGW